MNNKIIKQTVLLISVIATNSTSASLIKPTDSISDLHTLYNSGKATPSEVIDFYQSRIASQKEQRSILSTHADPATEKQIANAAVKQNALRPLEGVPVVVKDNIHVKGLPNTAGTPALAHFIPDEDAPVIARLKEAGAIIIAKTNMHELAYGITSNNYKYGAVKNAYSPMHSAGGSSGGTGAAIGSCLAPAGLGTDTGGSIRIPASVNGIVGLRPTAGRYSNTGTTPISSTRDTIGPMGRNVADVQLLDSVITNNNEIEIIDLKHVNLGIPIQFWENLDPEVRKIVHQSLDKLREHGARFTEVDTEKLLNINHKLSFPIVLHETKRDLSAYLKRYTPQIGMKELSENIASPDVRGIFESAIMGDGQVPETIYNEARHILRPQLQAEYVRLFIKHDIDALIFPTVPALPSPISGADENIMLNGKEHPTFPTYIRNTDSGSNAGLPGISIPAGLSTSGLPVGIAIDGLAWSDRYLLGLAQTIEAAIGKIPASDLCK